MTVTIEMIQKWNQGGGGGPLPGEDPPPSGGTDQEFEIPEMLPTMDVSDLKWVSDMFDAADGNMPGSLTPNQRIAKGLKDMRNIFDKHNNLMNNQQQKQMGSPFDSLNGGNVDFNSMNRPQNYTIQFGDVITNATAEDIGQEIAWQVRTL